MEKKNFYALCADTERALMYPLNLSEGLIHLRIMHLLHLQNVANEPKRRFQCSTDCAEEQKVPLYVSSLFFVIHLKGL